MRACTSSSHVVLDLPRSCFLSLSTVRTEWNKDVNNVVIECFHRSISRLMRMEYLEGVTYRQRMFGQWEDRGLFKSNEQGICEYVTKHKSYQNERVAI